MAELADVDPEYTAADQGLRLLGTSSSYAGYDEEEFDPDDDDTTSNPYDTSEADVSIVQY